MKCRHENEQLPIGRCASASCVVFHTREVLRTRKLKKCGPVFCHWCGDYVPLGPSNDTGCKVEIRAAELAGHMSWFLGGPGAPVDSIDKSELRGCGQHKNNGTPTNDYEHAGYLARTITDHDEKGEG